MYWTGPLATLASVDGQDHPDHQSSTGGYEVESMWLTNYWFRLARERRTIRVQLHTHPEAAFHSPTDDHWPVVAQLGFVSIVIPRFAMGAVSLEGAWAGSLGADGRWRAVDVEEVITLTP